MPSAASSTKPPTEAAIAHFTRNSHLAPLLSSPEYRPIAPPTYNTANLPPDGIPNAFFELTLSTPTTIPHTVSLQLTDAPPIPATSPTPAAKARLDTVHDIALARKQTPHALYLVALGNPGVSGHVDTAHGGVVSVLLDQVLGVCVESLQRPVPFGKATMTGRLQVRFVAPVRLPGDYVLRAWATGKEGRKVWACGDFVSCDGKEVYAEGSALMIEVKEQAAKL